MQRAIASSLLKIRRPLRSLSTVAEPAASSACVAGSDLRSPIHRMVAWWRRGRAAAPSPIEVRTIDVSKIGRGFVDPRQGGKHRIVVTVDAALFARLRDDAVACRKPVAAIIRERIDEAYAFRAIR